MTATEGGKGGCPRARARALLVRLYGEDDPGRGRRARERAPMPAYVALLHGIESELPRAIDVSDIWFGDLLTFSRLPSYRAVISPLSVRNLLTCHRNICL